MKQLVKFNSGNFMKADAVTTSRIIADTFEKEHFIVLRDIRNLEEKIKLLENKGAYKTVYTYYTNKQNGQTYKECQLNFNCFIMLTMSYTGEKAMVIKDAYITEFNRMRGELESTRYMRVKGMEQRKELTSAIQMFMKPIDPIVYPRITNYCYIKVFGKSAKDLKEQYDVKDIESLRSFVCEDKLKEVAKLELKVANWIEDFSFKESQIKEKLGID